MKKKKKDGKIFTPKPIAQHMFYDLLLQDDCIVKKHIIDNSCGDGAFLCEIVKACFAQIIFTDDDAIKCYFETYIHGIELDSVEYNKCLKNLDAIAEEWGVTGIKWDIQNRDALSCHDYDGKMDFVIANPPYIRTHDLECDLSGYSFADGGMKDIYLAFYELGFRMLNETGRMCYIAPSSWFASLAGQKMRDYIMETRWLTAIEDYEHEQLFENATTYVAIAVFDKENPNKRFLKYKRGEKWTKISYDDMCIDGKFYFGTPNQLKQMCEILEYDKDVKREDRPFQVKNGYATLADDVFVIGDVPWALGKYVVPTIKSSTKKWTYCIYPYSNDGKLISETELKDKSPMEYKWLCEHRGKLEARSTEEPWYAFGRTQAIKDTYKEKWAVKSTIKDLSEPIYKCVPAGNGVYGGLYILTEHPEGLKVLETQDFMNYVKMLGKYKSGGYYTFSSKELENYLCWSYGKKKD